MMREGLVTKPLLYGENYHVMIIPSPGEPKDKWVKYFGGRKGRVTLNGEY